MDFLWDESKFLQSQLSRDFVLSIVILYEKVSRELKNFEFSEFSDRDEMHRYLRPLHALRVS